MEVILNMNKQITRLHLRLLNSCPFRTLSNTGRLHDLILSLTWEQTLSDLADTDPCYETLVVNVPLQQTRIPR